MFTALLTKKEALFRLRTISPGFLLLVRSRSTWQTFDTACTPASYGDERKKILCHASKSKEGSRKLNYHYIINLIKQGFETKVVTSKPAEQYTYSATGERDSNWLPNKVTKSFLY